MDYFLAVREGKERVRKAVDILQEVAGPSYPVLFLKPGSQSWTPVGEENMYSLVNGKDSSVAIVVCDSGGNAKALSQWFNRELAETLAESLGSKIPRYNGEIHLPV
jgi:hypothetical protein